MGIGHGGMRMGLTTRITRLQVVVTSMATIVALAPVLIAAPQASAAPPPGPSLVVATPAPNTPNLKSSSASGGVNDVYAMAEVGTQIIGGGLFNGAMPPGDTNTADSVPVHNIVAFNQATGAINTSFQPALAGGSDGDRVDSLLPGPLPDTVYVGGSFATVNGSAAGKRLALLSTLTGKLVPGFTSVVGTGAVNSLKLSGGRLFVGGTFTLVGNVAHGGLATLNPLTGALDPYMTVQVAGHHSYTGLTGQAVSPVGVRSIDISPDGTRLIADGNFKTADGLLRDQIAMIDLGPTAVAVDPNWATAEFAAGCHTSSEDAWVRGLEFSPDGSFFVVTANGGNGTNPDGTEALCDSASRWETSSTGANVQPSWVDWTGEDAFYSVAITDDAVYVGGHERWVNNSTGHDSAGEGAVARPGVAALDPVSGVPYLWNPGRHPRGAGTYSLLATPQGLYTGYDTSTWGPPGQTFHRALIAFFPNGGEALPSTDTGSLPSDVFLASPSGNPGQLGRRAFDGTVAGATSTVTDPNSLDWSQVRGAFQLGTQLFYGYSDGLLYRRSFDGTTLGPPSLVDPYHQPLWDNVPAGGNGNHPYKGTYPTFYGTEIPTVTGMLYYQGRLYFTQSGKSGLRYRMFTPESGVVGSSPCVAGASGAGLLPCAYTSTGNVDFSKATGMFLSGSTLYYSDTNGNLHSVPWNSGSPDKAFDVVVSGPSLGGPSWKSQGMFLLPTTNPSVSFSAGSCVYLSCTATAAASASSGSTISTYAFDFGDGTAPTVTAAPSATHDYAQPGTYTVTVTVTDTKLHTASATEQLTATKPPAAAASFTASCAGLTCMVDGSASVAASGIASYTWDFGDGNSPTVTTVPTLSYPYAASGSYTITLTLTANDSSTDSTTQGVSVAPAPTASFTGSCPRLVCSFDASASTAPDSVITSYMWDFGDGSTGNGITPQHTYAGLGTYQVQLTVTNTQGGTASVTFPFSVTPGPTAAFTVSCIRLVCSVDASGSTDPGRTITGYQWDFGDTGSDSGVTSTHTYSGAGTFTIGLVVQDNQGDSSLAGKQITVSPDLVPISFVAQTGTSANAAHETVVVPPSVTPGDGLVLVATSASTPAVSAPAGWTLVASNSTSTTYSGVWERVAAPGDAGSSVIVDFGGQHKGTVQLLAYAGTSGTTPVTAAVSAATSSTTSSATTPLATVTASGSWVVSYWAARSSVVTAWTPPAGPTLRGSAAGSGGGHINSAAADSGAAVSPGSVGGITATTDQPATADVTWTIVLAPGP